MLQVKVANSLGVAHQLHRGSSKEGVQLYAGHGKFDFVRIVYVPIYAWACMHCNAMVTHMASASIILLQWYAELDIVHSVNVLYFQSLFGIACGITASIFVMSL